MKTLFVTLFTALLATSCASLETRWDSCEKGRTTFVEVADCTSKAVQEDASRWAQPTLRMRSEARAKRYATKVEDLIEKVATGRMSDADARAELRQDLNQLLDEERDDRLTPVRQPQKTGVTCSPSGGSVSCTAN
jgi:hypothetical protein